MPALLLHRSSVECRNATTDIFVIFTAGGGIAPNMFYHTSSGDGKNRNEESMTEHDQTCTMVQISMPDWIIYGSEYRETSTRCILHDAYSLQMWDGTVLDSPWYFHWLLYWPACIYSESKEQDTGSTQESTPSLQTRSVQPRVVSLNGDP